MAKMEEMFNSCGMEADAGDAAVNEEDAGDAALDEEAGDAALDEEVAAVNKEAEAGNEASKAGRVAPDPMNPELLSQFNLSRNDVRPSILP